MTALRGVRPRWAWEAASPPWPAYASTSVSRAVTPLAVRWQPSSPRAARSTGPANSSPRSTPRMLAPVASYPAERHLGRPARAEDAQQLAGREAGRSPLLARQDDEQRRVGPERRQPAEAGHDHRRQPLAWHSRLASISAR